MQPQERDLRDSAPLPGGFHESKSISN